jgi:hypothetical protein
VLSQASLVLFFLLVHLCSLSLLASCGLESPEEAEGQFADCVPC